MCGFALKVKLTNPFATVFTSRCCGFVPAIAYLANRSFIRNSFNGGFYCTRLRYNHGDTSIVTQIKTANKKLGRQDRRVPARAGTVLICHMLCIGASGQGYSAFGLSSVYRPHSGGAGAAVQGVSSAYGLRHPSSLGWSNFRVFCFFWHM